MADTNVLIKLKYGAISTLAQKEELTDMPLVAPDRGTVYFAVDTTNHKGKIVFDAPVGASGTERIVMSTDAEYAERAGYATNAGNASTADLANELIGANIDGIFFNGVNAITHYSSCATAGNVAEKVISCGNYRLVTGSRIAVKFGFENSANNMSLNVNSTGAKPVYYNGAQIEANKILANKVYDFIYDGNVYNLVGDLDTNTTYPVAETGVTGLLSGDLYTKLQGIDFDATYLTLQGTSPISVSDSVGDVTISHDDTDVSAGNYGDTEAQTPGFGGTFKVPSYTVNSMGHLTQSGEHTVTIPNNLVSISTPGLFGITDYSNFLEGITIAGHNLQLGDVEWTAAEVRQALGLSNALHFIGKATATISDGSTTDPGIAGYTTKQAGDVVIDADTSYEFVWTNEGKWERLGPDGSYSLSTHGHGNITNEGGLLGGIIGSSVVIDSNGLINYRDLTVLDPDPDGTNSITFIAQIEQNADGQIVPVKKIVRDASTLVSGVVNTTAQSFAGHKTFATNLSVINDASNESTTDSLVYFQVHNSNDWGLTISKGGNNKGLLIDGVGSKLLQVGTDELLVVNSSGLTVGTATKNVNSTFAGDINPVADQAFSLGSSGLRWTNLYVGTSDTYGSATKPIYWKDGVPTATSYSLAATVNAGATNRLAFYKSARVVDDAVGANFVTSQNSKSKEVRALHLWGTTVGNTAADLISGTAGIIRMGDGGPQITFSASESGTQNGALIFTDNDNAGSGVSWHFVTTEGDDDFGGNATVTAPRFRARKNLTVGTNNEQTAYSLYVENESYLHGDLTVDGNQTITGTFESTNETNSTSRTTGSAIFAGGVGVAKELWAGGIGVSTNSMVIDKGKVYSNLTGTNVAPPIKTTSLYADGIAIISPSVRDAGWMRVTGTTEADTTLEIATGDDGGAGEQIVVRQYNTSNEVAREVKLLDTNGQSVMRDVLPTTTNVNTLGSSTKRWKNVYIGTQDTYGTTDTPIYWNAGVPTPIDPSAMFSSLTSTGNTLTAVIANQDRSVNIINSVSNTYKNGVTGSAKITTTVNGVTGAAISIPINSKSVAGLVPAGGTSHANMAWRTDMNGVPSWMPDELAAPIFEDITLNAADWSGNQYTVFSNNVTADSIQIVSLPNYTLASSDEMDALGAAKLVDGGQAAGYFTLIALGDVPTINIDIRVCYYLSTDTNVVSIQTAAQSANIATQAAAQALASAKMQVKKISIGASDLGADSTNTTYPYKYVLPWSGVRADDWVDGSGVSNMDWAVESGANKIILHFAKNLTASTAINIYWAACDVA